MASCDNKKCCAQHVRCESKLHSSVDPRIEPWRPCAPPSIGWRAWRSRQSSVRPSPYRSKSRIASSAPNSPPSSDLRIDNRKSKSASLVRYKLPNTQTPCKNNRTGTIPERAGLDRKFKTQQPAGSLKDRTNVVARNRISGRVGGGRGDGRKRRSEGRRCGYLLPLSVIE